MSARQGRYMIINKVEVSAKGKNYSGIVSLALVQKDDGWTYEVDNMTGDNFALIWRTKTPEKASSKLRDIYKDEVWDFKIKE
ncbi:MAG: hypothetical protein U9Q84_01190 [Thermodesulfobacteriota bacterium]|nr:hypothetical protein [Thermodesulfobacteriota bacterium]